MKNFDELFKGYNFTLTEGQVKENVKTLIDNLYENTDRPSNIKDLFGHIEITSLNTTDNEEKIVSLVEKINALDENFPEMGKPAAICVYPAWVETVKNTLTEDVNITTVIGFPSSQTFIEAKVAETGLSLMAGANEIDMVISVGKFLQGNYEEVFEEAKEKYGENSVEANNYATKLEYLNQKIVATEKELKAQGGTLGAVGAQFKAVGDTLQNVGDKISTVGNTLTTKVTAPIAAVGAASVASFNELDDALDVVRSKTGATGDSFKEMEGIVTSIATSSVARAV